MEKSLLQVQIETDLTNALKAKDELKKNVLRGVIATASTLSKVKKQSSDSEEIFVNSLLSEVKKRKQVLEFVKEGPTYEATMKEIEILENYLPKPLSNEELITLVNELKEKGSSKGEIMKFFNTPKYKGRVDNKYLSTLI